MKGKSCGGQFMEREMGEGFLEVGKESGCRESAEKSLTLLLIQCDIHKHIWPWDDKQN